MAPPRAKGPRRLSEEELPTRQAVLKFLWRSMRSRKAGTFNGLAALGALLLEHLPREPKPGTTRFLPDAPAAPPVDHLAAVANIGSEAVTYESSVDGVA